MELTIDYSGWENLKKSLEMVKKKVRVGVPDYLAEKASKLEYGFTTQEGYFVPPRSHLYIPLTYREKEIANIAGNYIFSYPEKAPEVLGQECVKAIQESFETGGFGMWQRNAPLTIENKGRDEPNVDTGELWDSYTWEVE